MPVEIKLRVDIKNLQTILEVVDGTAEIVEMSYENEPESKPIRRRTTPPIPRGKTTAAQEMAAWLFSSRPERVDVAYARRWCTRNRYSESSATPILSTLNKHNVLKREGHGLYSIEPPENWNVDMKPKEEVHNANGD